MGVMSVAMDYGDISKYHQTTTVSIISSEVSSEEEQISNGECNACNYCLDICNNVDSCMSCQKKLNIIHNRQKRGDTETSWLMDALSNICQNTESQVKDNKQQTRTYTMCQLRRHNHAESAWILVGDTIYDATPYIKSHPGGTETILRKSGGVYDCTEDLMFHSKRAQKEWRKHKIGTLRRCRGCL